MKVNLHKAALWQIKKMYLATFIIIALNNFKLFPLCSVCFDVLQRFAIQWIQGTAFIGLQLLDLSIGLILLPSGLPKVSNVEAKTNYEPNSLQYLFLIEAVILTLSHCTLLRSLSNYRKSFQKAQTTQQRSLIKPSLSRAAPGQAASLVCRSNEALPPA